MKLVIKLRLGLSNLGEHKFKHSFQDMIHSLCGYGNDVEPAEQFLLLYPQFVHETRTLISTTSNFNYSIL